MSLPDIETHLLEHGINPDPFKYVCKWPLSVRTKHGTVHVPRGFLSDGASGPGIIDLEPEAFMAHDRLYVSPYVDTPAGERVRLTRWQCDLIYGRILAANHRWFRALVRPLGLALFNGLLPRVWPWRRDTWAHYRSMEDACSLWWQGQRMVPGAYRWRFPSWRLRDAVPRSKAAA